MILGFPFPTLHMILPLDWFVYGFLPHLVPEVPVPVLKCFGLKKNTLERTVSFLESFIIHAQYNRRRVLFSLLWRVPERLINVGAQQAGGTRVRIIVSEKFWRNLTCVWFSWVTKDVSLTTRQGGATDFPSKLSDGRYPSLALPDLAHFKPPCGPEGQRGMSVSQLLPLRHG